MATDRMSRLTAKRQAGERLLAAIQADEDLVDLLTRDTIEAKVEAGELLRGDALRVGKFEMVPVGEMDKLKDAIDSALSELERGQVRAAMDILEDTIPEDDTVDAEVIDADPEPDGDGQVLALGPGDDAGGEADPEPAKPRARRRHTPAPPEADEDEATDDPRRPIGLPRADRTYECEGVDLEDVACGAIIQGTQAQFSFTRFRRKLCASCAVSYNVASGKVEPGVDDDADVIAAN